MPVLNTTRAVGDPGFVADSNAAHLMINQLWYGTGWRDCTAEAIAGGVTFASGGYIHVIRRGATVTVRVRGLIGAAGAVNFLDLPAGWAAMSTAYLPFGAHQLTMSTTGLIGCNGGFSMSAASAFEFSYQTPTVTSGASPVDIPFPTTGLPGVAL